MPIPDKDTKILFESIRYASRHGNTLADFLPVLHSDYKESSEVHLDPDLRRDALERHHGWRPLFGQTGGAQAHLDNEQVGVHKDDVDLFLFYGYFRAVGPSHVKSGAFREGHVIFGWLQIAERYRREDWNIPKWASYHPHLSSPPCERVCKDLERRRRKGNNNTVFIARDFLSFLPSIEGGGVFPEFDGRLCLTANPSKNTGRSFWREDLPFLQERTRHRQEHIIKISPRADTDVQKWLMEVFACLESSGR
jgi:hypothetical protein